MSDEIKEEITNGVLAEQIKGLTKLTDERFSGLKESLIRIESNNAGYATKIELDEVKKDFNKTVEEIRKGFSKHNEDDKESFGGLSKGQAKLNNTVQRWGGALLLAAFALPIIVPLILHYIFKW